MRRSWQQYSSCSIWGGTQRSGSTFHYHNAAVNVLFFGTKLWTVTPPRWAGITDLDPDAWPDTGARAVLPRGMPLYFTQRAGDVLILPEQWGHSTLSVNFTVGLGMLWCGKRLTNLTGACHTRSSQQRAPSP